MRDGRPYNELGADYFDKRHAERAARRHVRQLEALGFQVTIETAASLEPPLFSEQYRRLQTGAGLRVGPMTFMHNGKQYVVVASP